MKKIHTEEDKVKIRETLNKTRIRHKSMSVRCFELKIVNHRLNSRQRTDLCMIFLEGKRLYNHILNEKKSNELSLNCINPTDFKNVTYFDKNKSQINYHLEYLPSHYKQTIHQRMISNEKTIRALVKSGYQKHGGLKFKSELNCIPLKTNDWKFKSKNKVWIMGVKGQILVRGTDQIPNGCEYANANLIHKPDGYYLNITCYLDKDSNEIETNGKEIGLDFGIKTNITISEGKKIDVSVEESERLKMLQRKLQRQVKGSNNRYKTIKKLRREYQYLSNVKKDKANKIVHELKQYSTIVIQDEQLNKWHQKEVDENGKDKNKGMRRIVQHSCMGLIKSKLINLPQTVVLDKYIPTTKWCPRCHKLNELSLNDRTYVCDCGYQEDRDVHSAKNMLNIKNMVFSKLNLVPTEHREIKREEFCKAERGDAKPITLKGDWVVHELSEINEELKYIGETPEMYKDAMVGLSSDDNHIIYSYDKLVESMMKVNNWTYEDAIEWTEYNTIRSLPYMSPYEPIIMFDLDN